MDFCIYLLSVGLELDNIFGIYCLIISDLIGFITVFYLNICYYEVTFLLLNKRGINCYKLINKMCDRELD